MFLIGLPKSRLLCAFSIVSIVKVFGVTLLGVFFSGLFITAIFIYKYNDRRDAMHRLSTR